MMNGNKTAKVEKLNPFPRVVLYVIISTLWGTLGGQIRSSLVQALMEIGLGSTLDTLLANLVYAADRIVFVILLRTFVFFSNADVKRTIRPFAIAMVVQSIAVVIGSVAMGALSRGYYRELMSFGRSLGAVGSVIAFGVLPVLVWWVIGSSFRKGMPKHEKSMYAGVAFVSILMEVMQSMVSYEYWKLTSSNSWLGVVLSLVTAVAMMLAMWKGVFADSIDSARGYKPEAAADGDAPASGGKPASRVKTQEVGRIRGDGLEGLNRDDDRDEMTGSDGLEGLRRNDDRGALIGSDGLEKLDREDELDKRWGRGKKVRGRFGGFDDGLSRFDKLESEERVIAESSREAIRVMEHHELQMSHDGRICDDDHK